MLVLRGLSLISLLNCPTFQCEREKQEEREEKRKRATEKKKQMSIIVCTQITNVNAILIKNEDLNFEIF